MAKLGMGAAVLISVILGVILLSVMGISGIFSLIIIGFVATYLTDPSQRSYKSGGFAGIILGVLIFIYGLFISPTLPVNPPSLSFSTMVSLELSGIFNLILGFVVSILVCYLFGSIGGLIAQKILKKKTKEYKTHTRRDNGGKQGKKPKRSLNRTYKN
ncbi:MAG TPA: hypothetical protein VK426_11760 [Methanobacterium sp.]|nr:hypothetical protein [Methanobacterium sp.]